MGVVYSPWIKCRHHLPLGTTIYMIIGFTGFQMYRKDQIFSHETERPTDSNLANPVNPANPGLWMLVVLICFSCGADSSRIGLDFFGGGSLDASYIDSATVRISTVKFDSLITSNADRILLGSNKDARLGRITALSYLQVNVADVDVLDDPKIVFDYLALVLPYDGYAYYDTTAAMTLNAHVVLEDIEPGEDDNIYNTSRFHTDAQPLGSVTFVPRPHQQDSVEIRLSSSFGQNFYQRAAAGDEVFQSNDEFLEYLKGFAVIPDTTGSSGIIGFKDASLRLYYYDRNVVPAEQKSISFKVNTANTSTRIIASRENPYLKSFRSYKDKVSSAYTDDESYIQSGAGLALRVDMPYLRDLKQLTNFYVTRAVLDVYTVRRSYNGLTALPETLRMYMADRRNSIYSSSSYEVSLLEDADLQRDTRYSVDVTGFVMSQMELQEFNENGLLFLLTDKDFRLGADRIYFHSKTHEYQTRLRIYYATVNE